jgi:hypothetical protein
MDTPLARCDYITATDGENMIRGEMGAWKAMFALSTQNGSIRSGNKVETELNVDRVC